MSIGTTGGRPAPHDTRSCFCRSLSSSPAPPGNVRHARRGAASTRATTWILRAAVSRAPFAGRPAHQLHHQHHRCRRRRRQRRQHHHLVRPTPATAQMPGSPARSGLLQPTAAPTPVLAATSARARLSRCVSRRALRASATAYGRARKTGWHLHHRRHCRLLRRTRRRSRLTRCPCHPPHPSRSHPLPRR